MILYEVFKTICDTKKPFVILEVLSRDPDMAVKSLTRGNFEHVLSILTKINTCGSPISPLDHCVILYYVFKTICGTKKTFAKPLYIAVLGRSYI